MSRGKVQIRNMRLRVGGITPEQARKLGEGIARAMAERIDGAGREIASLDLRVKSRSGSSIDRLTDDVVAAIAAKLRSRS